MKRYLVSFQLWFLIISASCIYPDMVTAVFSTNKNVINLVGIVDESSYFSALVQLFSIINNLNNPETLHVYYVLFPSDYLPYVKHSPNAPMSDSILTNSNQQDLPPLPKNFTQQFPHQVRQCFPSLKVDFVIWQPPESMQYLRNHSFEQQHIFARFYIPQIFPSLEYFLYLDNDIIVNTDITSLFHYPLVTTTKSTSSAPAVSPTSNVIIASTDNEPSQLHHNPRRYSHVASASTTHHHPASTANTVTYRTHATVLAMLTEEHPIYRGYLINHFNQSHPLFLRAKAHLGDSTFLNAGVFVVNARLWRQHQYTKQVEMLLRENAEQGYHLYDTSVGDQGLFYLLFHQDMTPLPAEYNMRRLPKKTFLLLEKQAQGVIHFASVTHGDALYLCRYPILHEMLSRAATPLYLATIQAFAHTHCSKSLTNASIWLEQECEQISRLCPPATREVQRFLQHENMTPQYFRGKATISTWPLKEQLWL